jgi:hypothetical protein
MRIKTLSRTFETYVTNGKDTCLKFMGWYSFIQSSEYPYLVAPSIRKGNSF